MTAVTVWVPFTSRVVQVGERERVDGQHHGVVESFSVERLIVFRRPVRRDVVHVRLDNGLLWQAYTPNVEIEARP